MGRKDKEFDRLSHAKLSVHYHVVLATKYRRKCLLGLEEALYGFVREAFDGMQVTVLDVGSEDGDHVHVLLRVRDSRLSIGRIVQVLKSKTTVLMWKEFPEKLGEVYWKARWKGHMLWSSGYFAASVGNEVSTVKRYIQKQA